MTAAEDKFCDIFTNFQKNKEWYFMRIICQQMILMKYHALCDFQQCGILTSVDLDGPVQTPNSAQSVA